MALNILESHEIKRLESLRLNPKRTFRGSTRGERLSRQKGVSIEFADFRTYSEGDDLRHLDWNVLARLDSPVVRTYQDEEDLTTYLLIDQTASMDFGEPLKSLAAQKLGSALGYCALNGGDRLRACWLGPKAEPSASMFGRSSARKWQDWLSRVPEDRPFGLAQHLQTLARLQLKSGLAIVVSDGLDAGIGAAIRAIGGRGFEVWFLQVLSEAEHSPDVEGDLKLVDCETGAPVEITVNRESLAAYRANLERHTASLAEAVRSVGGRFVSCTSAERLEDIVLRKLIPGGWLK
jgi:uncharacterized protein (DUF58 family)